MSGLSTTAAVAATNGRDKSAVNGAVDIRNGDADDKDVGHWFSLACKCLFESKAGTALYYTTGFEERSCQRYASGKVHPPMDFLRALLRSEQGETWLAVIMDGATPNWWLGYQRAQRIAAQFDQIDPR